MTSCKEVLVECLIHLVINLATKAETISGRGPVFV